LPDVSLEPGETLTVSGSGDFRLGDSGGAIALLGPDGLKVHGVSYTAQRAEPKREVVTF
jgi:hypothetical protein